MLVCGAQQSDSLYIIHVSFYIFLGSFSTIGYYKIWNIIFPVHTVSPCCSSLVCMYVSYMYVCMYLVYMYVSCMCVSCMYVFCMYVCIYSAY